MNNDLISRSSLKEKAFITQQCNGCEIENIAVVSVGAIDNAPTVELTEEQAIDKLRETGWLIRHDKEMTERPHGKWIYKQIHDYDYWECSNCGELCTEGTPKTMNFCPNCGADCRGWKVTRIGNSADMRSENDTKG